MYWRCASAYLLRCVVVLPNATGPGPYTFIHHTKPPKQVTPKHPKTNPQGIPDTPAALLGFLVQRTRANLHIVLTFSPVGPAFRCALGWDMRGWMDGRDGWPAATISTIHTHTHPQSKIITHILNPQSPPKTRNPPGSAPAASLRSSTARASMSSTPGPARRSFRWPRRVGCHFK